MGTRKPEPDIYLKLLQEEGMPADRAIFFDDNADNIKGAQQVGITSVLVTGKETVPDYFAKNPC
jgi:putative hydrolase of the HAD superfamily